MVQETRDQVGSATEKEASSSAAARWLFERDLIRRFKGDIFSKIYKRDLAKKTNENTNVWVHKSHLRKPVAAGAAAM